METPPKEELQQKIPYESMVRCPDLQSLESVPYNYMTNMVDLSDFLSSSFDCWKEIVSEASAFTQWILWCHEIAGSGKDGNRLYSGRSKVGFSHNKHLGKLRRTNRLFITLKENRLREVHQRAQQLEDSFSDEPWIQDPPRKLFRCAGIEYQVTYVDRPPLLPSDACIIRGFQHTKDAVVSFPHPLHIPDYHNRMCSYLSGAFESLNEPIQSLQALASYYKLGVMSQSTHAIWNSVLMAQLNEFYSLLGFNRIPHEYHDAYALILEGPSFQKYFIQDMVMANNDLQNLRIKGILRNRISAIPNTPSASPSGHPPSTTHLQKPDA
ncbi:MAG TPA: hypothetical protein VJB08_05880 [Candidatus Nanoarchaeia archaeon]|nr:hypothetical protein [Candidatus Nanoarchaeia archaeon]